jgi:hypothetical protein
MRAIVVHYYDAVDLGVDYARAAPMRKVEATTFEPMRKVEPTTTPGSMSKVEPTTTL